MRNPRGFTLAEVLAALGILAIGIVGVLVVVPVASHALQEGNQLTTATFLAEQRLEQVRNAPWSSVPDNDCLGIGPASAPVVPGGKSCANGGIALAAGAVTFSDEPSVAGYPGYGRTVRIRDCGVSACGGVSSSDLRQVTVTVTYRPLTGAGVAPSDRSIALNLIVARR